MKLTVNQQVLKLKGRGRDSISTKVEIEPQVK